MPEDEDVYEGGDIRLVAQDQFVVRDTGIDGAGASAEEKACHDRGLRNSRWHQPA